MKKLIWYLVVLGVTIAVSLSGCGDSDTTTTTEAEKADKTTTTEATEKSAIDFPQEGKDIRWIVPFSPGGGFDTYARTVSRFLPKYLPNEPNVIVENILNNHIWFIGQVFGQEPADSPSVRVKSASRTEWHDPPDILPLLGEIYSALLGRFGGGRLVCLFGLCSGRCVGVAAT